MQLRFTLRDMLWGAIVCALMIGWSAENWRSRIARTKADNWDRHIRHIDGIVEQTPREGFGPGTLPPVVLSATDILPGEPLIIHIRDWHLVSRDDYAASTGLIGNEFSAAYEAHLETVRAVQLSQRRILAEVDEAYCEGISEEDSVVFEAIIRSQKRSPTETTLLHLGAAAQLMIEGKLQVLPCESEAEHAAADRRKNGEFEIDDAANEAREDAIVRNVTKAGGTAYLVLGGAHDLKDNVERVAKGWGYRVVTPRGYPQ